MSTNNKGWWRYEYTVVLVHWFIWGFVALDRNLIAFLFPKVLPDLKIGYAEAGMIMSVLGFAWAFSALLGGGISDKVGRKKVIIPVTIAFSLLSWATGLVKNFGQLIGVRIFMGISEGAYIPTAVATISEEATPGRRGLMLGLHQSAYAVVGLLLAPIYATQVAEALGWRWACYLTIIPGIILALLHWKFIREPKSTAEVLQAKREMRKHDIKTEEGVKVTWKDVLKHRNIIVVAIMGIGIMAWLFNFIAFGTVFLTDLRGIKYLSAGKIMSLFGLGGVVGYIGLNLLSDYIGRKPSAVISGICCALVTSLFAYGNTGPGLLMLFIFLMGLFGMGIFVLVVATIPGEAVPFALVGLAAGIANFIGEFFGAAIMPTIGGLIAKGYGLQACMLVSIIGTIVTFVAALFLKETAPRVLARKA